MTAPDMKATQKKAFEQDQVLQQWRQLRLGTYYFPTGEKYVGEWENDSMNGQGTIYLNDGSRYQGEFVEGRMEGQGNIEQDNLMMIKSKQEHITMPMQNITKDNG